MSTAKDDDEAAGAVASVEDQALTIFLQGVEDEEEGKLYEAIVKYKKVRRRNIGFESCQQRFSVLSSRNRNTETLRLGIRIVSESEPIFQLR